MDRAKPDEQLFSISRTERDTGLSKDTLRIWERRYAFPRPQRDSHGERVYSTAEVEKLRLLKQMVDRGHRPGKIVELETATLLQMLEASTTATQPPEQISELEPLLTLLKGHYFHELRQQLADLMLRLGLGKFVAEVVAPLTRMVGQAWLRGDLQVYEEHLYSETVQGLLRGALSNVPLQPGRPRVLLTTLPNEQHQIGLLMATVVLSLEGASCTSLGAETPIRDIVAAATSDQTDVVALSFSAAYSPVAVIDGLAELRAKLPATIELWVGGAGSTLGRRMVADVRVIPRLEDIRIALADWRSTHP
jgi:DNA-binding transcriptional MerR regulator/methylmalonyl-CoA mutase cobalamin-binding subunit